MKNIKIDTKSISSAQPSFIIAEIGQNHDGSLGAAHAYIDAIAKAGVDAVKFQTHIAHAESTIDEPFRVKFSKQDDTRYAYWKRMEFSANQWEGLRDHAIEQGLIFLSSAFSIEAVELLDALGMPAWKIGSGEYKSTDLLNRMMKTGKPILLSTGMSTWAEIDEAAKFFKEKKYPFALFQCTSKYPTSFKDVGLNILEDMKERYDVPIGLSDHSGYTEPALAAIARGAAMIEVHATFDKNMFGPDVIASLTVDQIKQICAMRDAMATMLTNPVNKDEMALKELKELRKIFTKSFALNKDMQAGTTITQDMISLKKPGTGIVQAEQDQLIGRTLKHDVPLNRLLRWDDFQKGDSSSA